MHHDYALIGWDMAGGLRTVASVWGNVCPVGAAAESLDGRGLRIVGGVPDRTEHTSVVLQLSTRK